MTYDISADAEGISCNLVSAISAGNHDTITAEYFTSSLSPGLYNATITITDPSVDDSIVEIPVTLTVSEKSPIYRFWSAKNRAHFYTISESEKNNIAGWGNVLTPIDQIGYCY